MSDELPEDVRVLLRQHIESFDELESLLLLRQEAGADFSPDAVAARLGVSPDAAAEALRSLVKAGVVVAGAGGVYRFGAVDAGASATVAKLAEAYRERRVEVMRLLSANAIERLRTAAMRRFADAFLLRRKNDG